MASELPDRNAPLETWTPSWHWVRGVVVEENGARTLMPRDAGDVMSDMNDDVCL